MDGEPSASRRRVDADAGAASDRLLELASMLKRDSRLTADADIDVSDHVIEVRRGDTVVLITRTEELDHEPLASRYEPLGQGREGLLLMGNVPEGLLEQFPPRAIVGTAPSEPTPDALYLGVHGLLERLELRRQGERKGRWLKRYRYELGELIEIARAITQERDIDRLLDLILERSRFITGADAGSIYVLEGRDPDITSRTLRFKLSHNDSVDFESSEFTMPVSTRSMAGYAAATRQAINIPDVHAIAEDASFGFDSSFDERTGYLTRSMIAVPMISAEDDVIGVIQLINRKRDADEPLETAEEFDSDVIPFDERSEELLATLASQAGIALENALLYDEIKRIFEGFVRASVQAIEQRDPTTSGHSLRVSVLGCRLAEVVDRVDSGRFAQTSFTRRELKELEYAALLHDFGKIGVREEVLVKAKKLYPHELESVRERVHYALKSAETDALARKLELIERGAPDHELKAVDDDLVRRRIELEDSLKVIVEANEPSVLSEGDFTRIGQIGEMTFVDGSGQTRPLLTSREVGCLQVTKGSLNQSEMDEIRSHVVHTFGFLSRIPWGKSFTDIPRIAAAHHEKLDGSGYPYGLVSEQIPLQSKIMAVADIYDALTARDRPYKKAVPVERALDILGFEVDGGKLDPELVRIFREAGVYREVERELEY